MSHYIEKCEHGAVGRECLCVDVPKHELRIDCPPHCDARGRPARPKPVDAREIPCICPNCGTCFAFSEYLTHYGWCESKPMGWYTDVGKKEMG